MSIENIETLYDLTTKVKLLSLASKNLIECLSKYKNCLADVVSDPLYGSTADNKEKSGHAKELDKIESMIAKFSE